ncbi:ferritin-like domain-containing protein [Streptomyces xiaopingdaonensis]|uniref:ferritin-like domain-containing protein n=1 Tax=Streptomyces xiaopingdaonensis TaxID=1565415 RepID=UPI00031EBC2A|nr:ferritin-like domain-containing protein [Streptomyces xiaopingdaonensis]
MTDFRTDVDTVRDRAGRNTRSGLSTASYGTDADRVGGLPDTAPAAEAVCVLRFRQRCCTAKGLDSEPVASEFPAHSNEKQRHADRASGRIVQLGGSPLLGPPQLTGRAHAEYRKADDEQTLRENPAAECVAIASRAERINRIGADQTSREVLEPILAKKEEEHADEMLTFLEPQGSHRPAAPRRSAA